MANESLTLDGCTVQYGKTTVQELLNRGYTISDFEQIIEEPALASCHLNKDNALVATLNFWDIKEKITQEQLYDFPIDLALLEKKEQKKRPNAQLTPQKAFQKKIAWTILIHCIAAVIFFCLYSFPALFSWVQNAEFRARGGSAPMGIVLLMLPALLIAFIWGGAVGEKGAPKKIALVFGLILNVVVSLAYLVLIDNLFTHRFF